MDSILYNDKKLNTTINVHETEETISVDQSKLTTVKTDEPIYNITDAVTQNKFDNASKGTEENYWQQNQTEDTEKPLILTPLIKEGKANIARSRSKVNPKMFLGVESYSGFLTVDEKYNSNLFFWYFPVPDKPVNQTPWLIWLQGGPGASSMFGLLKEIGPISFNSTLELQLNEETWNKQHSLLFIDNPVGTGFSFTNDSRGFAHFTNISSVQLREAVQQFLEIFPELRESPLFITGESYAGRYVPGLAMEIHRNKHNGGHINLQGLAIGNGYIDGTNYLDSARIAYYFGIVDSGERKKLETVEKIMKTSLETNNTNFANIGFVIKYMIASHIANVDVYNILKNKTNLSAIERFFASQEIRKAIHVGSQTFAYRNETVNNIMKADFLINYTSLIEELLEYYRVLIYSGHLDLMVPYVLTAENIRTWNWSGKGKFISSPRHPWIIDDTLTGFHKSGGNLTEVMVWNAGHMVPIDQPRAARLLIESFTSDKVLPRHKYYLLQNLLSTY